MSSAYTIPPTFIGLIVAIAAVVIAYHYGFSSGFSAGRAAGYGDGKEEGDREGSMRGYAVGYDRGRRQDEGDDGVGSPRRAGLGIAALILGAIAFVVMVNKPRDPFDPSFSPGINSHDLPPGHLLDEPSIDPVSWPPEPANGPYRNTPEYVPGELLDEPSID